MVEECEVDGPQAGERGIAFELETPKAAPDGTPELATEGLPARRVARALIHPDASRVDESRSVCGSTADQLTRGTTTPGRPAPIRKSDSPWSTRTSKWIT